ncbi:ion transporter [Aldersonia kunmingensis]|uniref:ion transporter n=1 Tax=Aldersonia kunmingensis TaxID=408066 RepID=UPI00082FA14C|nr:ion transporter [Aldersonia kunmingensis]
MDTPASHKLPRHYPSRPPVGVLDWFMLTLAVISTGYLVWITFWDVPPETEQIIFKIDYVVCAIFAAEFAWRWHNARWSWKFPLVYWYEVLGMIPVAVPWLRSLRLLRVVAILSRAGRAADRAVGDRVTNAVFSRITRTVVEVVKRPITVAVLDEVAMVLKSGHYTRNISAALRENQNELDEMILELIREDPTAGRLRYVPFHDDIVRLVADTVFRIVFEVLDDARTDELVSDMLRENIDQIRAAVQGKYEKEGPMAPLHVVGFLNEEEAGRFH